ncbi:MAG: hydrogenase maturation protease [bacterium]
MFIGAGNPHAGDDRAGRRVADLLAEKNLSDIQITQCLGDAAELIELFEKYQTIYCCDAVRQPSRAGKIYRFEAHKKPLPVELFSLTTHDFGLPQAVELARSMNKLPEKLVIYGIAAANFQPGAKLTPEVETAAHEVAERLVAELNPDQQ